MKISTESNTVNQARPNLLFWRAFGTLYCLFLLFAFVVPSYFGASKSSQFVSSRIPETPPSFVSKLMQLDHFDGDIGILKTIPGIESIDLTDLSSFERFSQPLNCFVVRPDGRVAFALCHDVKSSDAVFQLIDNKNEPLPFLASELRENGVVKILCLAEKPKAKLSFKKGDSVEFDLFSSFGLVKTSRDSAVTTHVEVCNVGAREITIEKIHRSCGCLAVSPETPVTLLPLEKQLFSVELRAGGLESVTQSLAFVLKDAENERKVVKSFIWGNNLSGVQRNPSRIILKPEVGSSIVNTEISLVASPFDPFDVTAVVSNISGMDIKWSVIKNETDGRTFSHLIKLQCDVRGLRPGVFEGRVSVNTSSKTNPLLELPIVVDLGSAFELTPNNFVIGPIKVGDSRNMPFSIKGGLEFSDEHTFEIVGSTGNSASNLSPFTLELQKSKNIHQFCVKAVSAGFSKEQFLLRIFEKETIKAELPFEVTLFSE